MWQAYAYITILNFHYCSPTGHFDNIHSDDAGIARQNFTDGRIGLHGAHSIIGKSLAVS